MKTAMDRREESIQIRQNRTDYGKGVVEGHFVGRKTASYLKTHTRCTKGHGWTTKGEFGGCAQCEEE